ncbi:MobF family relaxase [Dietzia psychralcaliphila]|uniref:MobF family relaxase n=2 Tax=Dietzia TaxID=37914 RepID=UPI000D30DD07|nr:MobF family relaxase [Dietzia psychralcaliphila]PTM83811.1 conjugative relaxase-like TrwC/TraI family protein [Dietzia psychralcaliphila]
MSLRAVHAGTGYQYLLRSVATHDADPQGMALSDYYAAKGTPPGRWIGSGLQGLNSQSVTSGATVTEAQMAALYGEGLHPDTDQMMAGGKPLAACKLGRSFPLYTGGVDVLEAIATAEKSFLAVEGRRPTTDERGQIAEGTARPFYSDEFGYEHASGKDVIAWVNRERDQVKQAVAGFDFTFSPVKSVSVLWALADENTASRVAVLHHEAVAEALAWAEDNAIYTRVGTGGIKQVKTSGIIASEFTHFDTRCGDPDLHSHVLLANKVQGPDGRWLSLDSRAIHQMHQAISARYDAILHDLLTRRMGVEFQAHYPHPDKAPIWEISGIDRRLIEAFSSRRTLARPVYDRLVAEYVEKNNRQPSQRAAYALWQKAILDTRDAKKPAQSLSEHRAAWREMAEKVVGTHAVDRVVGEVTGQGRSEVSRELFDAQVHSRQVAEQAVAAVTARRAQFRRSHIDTAVSTALKGYRFEGAEALGRAHEEVMATAMGELVVQLTPPEILDLPSPLIGPNGAGVDRHANAEKYTTQAVLDAETATLEAAHTPVAVIATRADLDSALAAHTKAEGWSLNAGQTALAQHLVGAGTLLAAGVGPAGTGKTASMKVVARTWQQTGRSVIGLAPSAAAAAVLAGDIGTDCHTIDSLTFTWMGKHPNLPGKSLDALPVSIKPGDMLLVDEAGMASTENLAALTEIAAESGAILRLIGDPKQLAAVETGGLFADLTRTPGTPQLREVMRMGADTDQADATLGLREGDPGALALYNERGWITGGHREQMLTQAVEAFLAGTKAGRQSLIIASTNTDVDTLNEVIRSSRIAHGLVDDAHTTRVARGDTVGVGDTVIARTNSTLYAGDRTYLGRVINGQLFTVTGITDDGSLAVRDQSTGQDMLVPSSYAGKHVHLGYAATIHRAQGATVDTTHAVIDTSVDRAGLYVAMTRGKRENRAYAVCEPVLDLGAEDAHMHSAGDHQAPTPTQMLAGVLARDTHQASATETLRQEYAAATSDERLEQLYRHGAELAARDFTAATFPAYIDALPRAYAHQLEADPDQYQALAAAWTEAATRGLDPRDLWQEATENLDTANQPGTVIAHRIRHATGETTDSAALPTPPPVAPGCDTELTTWLAETHRTLAAEPAATAVARAASFTAEDFVASYLDSRSAEHEPGPDTHPTTSSPWGPSPDSSPDLW